MITSQAAVVIAAFRHLTSIVSVMAPERMPEVMSNLATAATQLDPHVVMQMMQTEDDPTAAVPLVRGLAAAFDDSKVAQLLATALALEGKASDRLATIFNTIAPDEDRKRRVLTMTRTMLSETDFGKAGQTGQFQVLWASMEELLISYNDKPFVSESYQAALDGVGGRAERMATADDLPPGPARLDGQPRPGQRPPLSVTLLIDLFTLETGPGARRRDRRRPGGAGRGSAAVGRLRRYPQGDPCTGGTRQDPGLSRPRRQPAGARSARRVAGDARDGGTSRRRRRRRLEGDSRRASTSSASRPSKR